MIETHGLFCSLYTDRAPHYFHTPEAGGKVGRALAQLGIEHIAAYSPAARGRSERMFATLQDRQPKDLALAGIANRFIAEHYLPRHNARFAVTPAKPGPAFVPDARRAAHDILCIQYERQFGNDNTVRYNGFSLADRGNQTTGHMKPLGGSTRGFVDNAAPSPVTPQAPRPQQRSIHVL